jgi:GNAT superfamily N-acetyltransferase
MYTITTDKDRLDTDRIHQFLSEESYWAAGIPREIVERSIENSMCFAALDGDDLVAFARVITDYATYAYLADFFVVPEHRGRGAAKQLMTAIRDHRDLNNLRRWHLVTRDAHKLYEGYGFQALEKPESHMEAVVKNAYLS